ncbi:hypothetical protein [Hwangdonia seohaensis]|uniref:Uncharacterized protein n=1 Tax=Hwangdonia seohaensis TaxID=1240727 RepID=A0ABW3R7E4_9FLAO|nr:hypothetical protein [Hwangdonia seohaensis]
MKTTFLIKFFLILLISMSSCDDDNNIDQNLYYYDQTGCSDPWNTGKNDSNTKTATALKQYFENLNVDILGINFENISQEGENSCDACACTTGVRILINILESDNQKVIDVGFKKVE